MKFKKYKEMINRTWDDWGVIPQMVVSTLNELFTDTLDECIVYPKDFFFTSESIKKCFLIFGPQKLYVIEFDNVFHEIKPFKYSEVNYIVKREANYSITVDLIIKGDIIHLNPLTDSNSSWEHKFQKYLIEIIKFLEKQ
ncbi:MAG: hypothetical protein ABS920_04965 [Sporosarcina sp.]